MTYCKFKKRDENFVWGCKAYFNIIKIKYKEKK